MNAASDGKVPAAPKAAAVPRAPPPLIILKCSWSFSMLTLSPSREDAAFKQDEKETVFTGAGSAGWLVIRKDKSERKMKVRAGEGGTFEQFGDMIGRTNSSTYRPQCSPRFLPH